MKLEPLLNRPTVTNFERVDLGTEDYIIFKTTVEELTSKDDNTGVIDAQIRALTAALENLSKKDAKLPR